MPSGDTQPSGFLEKSGNFLLNDKKIGFFLREAVFACLLIGPKFIVVFSVNKFETSTEPVMKEDAAQNRAADSICALFEVEEEKLLRYAFTLVGRQTVAEELVQDVFLQLHSHWHEVEHPRAWLYQSLRNRAYNHHRDNRREVITSDFSRDSAEEDEDRSPEAVLQRIEAAGLLKLLLSDLEPDDRLLIELKYYHDLTYSQMGERTGLSSSNVGYRLHHILKQLAIELRLLGIDGATPPTK